MENKLTYSYFIDSKTISIGTSDRKEALREIKANPGAKVTLLLHGGSNDVFRSIKAKNYYNRIQDEKFWREIHHYEI